METGPHWINKGGVMSHVEEVARKLRATIKELGRDALKDAVIVGSEFLDGRLEVCGVPYIDCPTIAETHLGKVDYKVARYFEDV